MNNKSSKHGNPDHQKAGQLDRQVTHATPTLSCSELIAKAGLTSMVMSGKKYHSALPEELERFYCYTKDGGHCILSLLPSIKVRPVEDCIVPVDARIK